MKYAVADHDDMTKSQCKLTCQIVKVEVVWRFSQLSLTQNSRKILVFALMTGEIMHSIDAQCNSVQSH